LALVAQMQRWCSSDSIGRKQSRAQTPAQSLKLAL
jgi:hypothetical protein